MNPEELFWHLSSTFLIFLELTCNLIFNVNETF